MVSSSRLEDLLLNLSGNDIESSAVDVSDNLGAIIDALPGLSRHKDLRKKSEAFISAAPIDLVAEKLSQLAGRKQMLQATDVGLALEWVDAVLSSVNESSSSVDSLLKTQGQLLQKLLVALNDSNKGAKSSKRMKGTLIHNAHRGLLKCAYNLRETFDVKSFIESLNISPSVPGVAEAALLVSVYNKATDPNFTSKIDNSSAEVLAKLWCTVVLNSKPQEFNESIVPLLKSGLLDSFWEGGLISQGTFDGIIVPALQKALLRSPDGVVSHVIPSLLSNPSLVMNGLLECPSLVSNLASSNQQLRQATASSFGDLLAHSKNPKLDGLISQFKKVTNSEQRALFAQVFQKCSKDMSEAANALATQAPKESAELSLRAIADAVVHFLPEQTAAVEAVKKGLGDARKPLRREWVLALASSENVIKSQVTINLFSAELMEALREIKDNMSAAVTSKFATAAFGIISLVDITDVPESLFEPRIYEHLSNDREYSIVAKACAKLLSGSACDNCLFTLPAFAFVANNGTPKQRLDNLALLRTVCNNSKSMKLAPAFVETLSKMTREKSQNVSMIVSQIKTKQWMIEAFVLAHEPMASPSRGWIQMCLKASLDPHDLVLEQADELFSRTLEARNVDAMATLAFVAPDAIAIKIDDYLLENLRGEKMSSLDAAILVTPEGQLVSEATQARQSRSRKPNANQSDEAWEEELRKEIAKKHGKLTPEQKAELDHQTQRRNELLAVSARIEFSCALLSRLAHDLAKGAENGSLVWIPDGINLCLGVVHQNVPGSEFAAQCLSSLSVCLSDRFKGHWKMVASKLLLQGKKLDLEATRKMLYMLNPVSDKRLLDPSTLVYILPVLRTVLAEYNGEVEDETADEAVLLVTSLLANQAEVLAVIPRGDLVSVLLTLLGQFAADRGAVKDCLRRVAQRVEFSDEELHMLLDASVAEKQGFVRGAALEVIDAEVDLEGRPFSPEIWISRFGQFSDTANDIWVESKMQLPGETALKQLLPFFAVCYASVSEALAQAFSCAALVVKQVSDGYDFLQNLYIEKKQPPKKILNSFGMEVKQKWVDPVPERLSIFGAMGALVPHLVPSDVIKCAKFIVDEGVTDKAIEASVAALELGKRLIEEHGKKCVDELLPVFDDNVILFGFAAQHLPENDSRLTSTVEKLLAALPTASEQNRNVIVESIGPLATRIDSRPIIERTLEQAFMGSSSDERRGAAFGFAGLTRGVGLSTLGDVSIVNAVSGGVEDRKDAARREGAQLLVIALSQVFGQMFEPYAIELMPQVLTGLGDMNLTVRETANEAARSIMSHTTSFGIKRQIPLALDQLDTTAWRGKKGAVELLGSMAYLSPQQLATSLATIVPEIVALLNDTHKEVRSSAKRSMKMFGDVIQNPEIHKLVPTLLGAISDPTNKTDAALTDLLKTRFMHYIDSPSLALIIFVVQRGLRDRSASTKRKACQIVGNMSILTAGRDLVPYLPTIMPDLQVAMTDPVPQTCAVACKALGVLVEKLGEEYFPNVIPDMIATLQSDDPKSVGNRWGTAQGLAEVLHGLGTGKLDELLPEIVANCQSPLSHVRQGFVPLLLLLPGSFGASLTPYLSQLVPPLLRGLADQLDDIRENALKAGRRIVRGYATIAVDLLLPELETGLGSPTWRIRLASVELVGDLLMELLGKSNTSSESERLKAIASAPPTADGETADVDNEDAAKALAKESESTATETDDKETGHYVEANLRNLEILGIERRDRVLASLFVCRADVVAAVRQAALDTWLALIQNTPRAVKLILPTLVLMLVRRLGDDDEELQTNAARALAELVRRVSGALKLILPTFLQHLADHDARQGICLGLVELVPATPVHALQEHEHELMHLVRTCLQDSNNAAREAATRALDELHSALGDITGDMLPEMVQQVVSENDEGALAAIKEMLASTGAGSVLGSALPALLHSDLDEFKTNAIAELCAAASASDISPYVESIVDRLIRTPYSHALDMILTQSCPESHLLAIVKNDEQLRSRVFERMAAYYTYAPKVDMLFVSDWVVFGLHGLEHENTSASAEELLRAITSSAVIGKPDLARLASTAYQTLQLLATPIPAFGTSAKGPAFVLPFFLQGLALGSNLEKEQSALAIAEIIRRTSPAESLKPVVTQITGPLIRIVGERTAPDVKAAIIYTLNVLLTTIPMFLKPFLPQLQRTFAKNLADPSSAAVRTRSAMALGSLIKLQTRIDPLAKEIVLGVRNASDAGVRTAFLTALHEIVCHAGKHLGEAVKQSVVELVGDSESVLEVDNSANDIGQSSLFARVGADVVALASEEENPKRLVDSLISRRGRIQSVLNANALYVHAPKAAGLTSSELGNLLEDAAKKPTSVFSENGVAGLGKLLLNETTSSSDGHLKPYEESAVRTLVSVVAASDEGRSLETRRLSIVILGALIDHHKTCAVLKPFLDDIVPPMFLGARDRNVPIKIASEKTFMKLFDFVGRKDSVLFDEWLEKAKGGLDSRLQRSLPEYVRRVAMRAADRDQDTEEVEPVDELKEIWAVGLE